MSTALIPRPSSWRPLWTLLTVGVAATVSTLAFFMAISHLACGPQATTFEPGAPPPVALSLTQAVEVAERQSKGRATQANLEREGWGWVYAVRLVAPSGATEVRVDADEGRIVSVSSQ